VAIGAFHEDAFDADAFSDVAFLFEEAGIVIPDVVGETQASGTATLEGEGFVVAVQTAYSSTVPAGEIISQAPTAGTEAAEGSSVTITVSLGEAPEQPQSDSSGGWAFYLRYEQERERRRKKRREQQEAEDAVEELPPVEKEIAQILHKQERIDESKKELERLKGLVQEFRDIPLLSEKATEALERARQRGLRSDLAKLDRELKRMLEDEEMAVLMLLLND
jgi:hypothetical protein